MWWESVEEIRNQDQERYTVTPETKLPPFHTKDGSMYDANAQRDWFSFNYTYPELRRWDYIKDGGLDWEAYNKALKLKVEDLYGKQERHAFNVPDGVIISPHHEKLLRDGEDLDLDDYVVNVRYSRFAIGGASYTIHIYLAGQEAGIVYNFSSVLPDDSNSADEVACANCQEQRDAGVLSMGQVLISSPLTRLVGQPGGPAGPARADKIAWLEQPDSLTWKVTVRVASPAAGSRACGAFY